MGYSLTPQRNTGSRQQVSENNPVYYSIRAVPAIYILTSALHLINSSVFVILIGNGFLYKTQNMKVINNSFSG